MKIRCNGDGRDTTDVIPLRRRRYDTTRELCNTKTNITLSPLDGPYRPMTKTGKDDFSGG